MAAGDRIWTLRDADLSWRELDGEIVVLDLRAGRYLSLNPVAVPLWGALRAGASLEALVRILVDRHAVAEARALDDCRAFLDDLEARDLVR